MAQLIWMYEQLAGSGNWQDRGQFIAATGDCDAFGVRQREQIEARLVQKQSWWKGVIRGRR